MEPFQSGISKKIRLLSSICTFGLLAPFLISFRKEKSSEEDFYHKRDSSHQITINQTEQEKSVLKSRKSKR